MLLRYTTKDSLQYVPLAELLASAAEEKPDLLVLCGPFVDINQSGIKDSRLVELTHQEVFYERVVAQVNKFCLTGSPGTRVVMVRCLASISWRHGLTPWAPLHHQVPSERDVHHDFVFPQPPFSVPRDEVRGEPRACHTHAAPALTCGPCCAQRGTAEFEINGNISFARNPSTVRCHGVDFGVASVDVLKYMNIATVSNAAAFKEPGRRLAVRVEQCLLQRSFMPIFPPPHNLPLDVSRLQQADMPTTPHVLLVPSDLKFMAKPVLDGQVMLINPCRLCKGESAGTFARVFVPTGAAAQPLPAAKPSAAPDTDAAAGEAKDMSVEGESEEKPAAAASAAEAEAPMACDIQVEIVRV